MSEQNGSKHNTSHDYAKFLREQADFLESRPAFNLPSEDRTTMTFLHYYEKEPFIAAVKAVGAGKKEFTENEVTFRVERTWGLVELHAPRRTVCRLVRAAEYDCDPFLTPAEEAVLG